MSASRHPAQFIPRATRFRLSLPLQYRRAAEPTWRAGEIQNISHSGVFFHADETVALDTLVELTFKLSAPLVRDEAAHVVCQGQVVRTGPADGPGDRTGLAVAISGYRFERRR
jgi:hypothetical protein